MVVKPKGRCPQAAGSITSYYGSEASTKKKILKITGGNRLVVLKC
jgi:hypothetical protein